MLGKLIKYEWKSTYKICSALLLIMVVMTILGCASFFTPLWSAAFRDDVNSITPLDLMGLLTLFFYVITIVGVMWGILIYIGVHFYKSMYSDEGYLTHTLPVNSHQMLGSKILVNGFWYVAVLLLFMLSLFCLCYSILNVAYVRSGSFQSLTSYLSSQKDEIVNMLENFYGKKYILSFLFYVLMMITGSFTSVIIVFGAITIGQLSAKHKVMMSIVSYFVIIVVSQFVSSIFSIPITISSTMKMINNPYSVMKINYSATYMVTMIVNIAFSVVLYFVSNYIITRKLNLD